MTSKQASLVPVLLAVVALAGCGTDAEPPAGVAVRAKLNPVPHAAWLSRHLPAETIAYARIPTLWDAFSEPKEDALHPVQAGTAHSAQIDAIREALLDNVVTRLPPPAQGPIEMLLARLRSPIEVVALKPADGSFAPNTLLAAQAAMADAAALSDWLTRIVEVTPQLRILTPIDAEGYLTMMAGPVPVYGRFDQEQQRLLLLTGVSASRAELTRHAGAAPTDSSLSDFERRVDASGRGLALWLDIGALWSMYAPMMPPEQVEMLTAAGLNQAQFLWLGAASKDGKSSLKVHLAMPHVGFRTLFARADQTPGLNSAGAADFVLRVILPSVAEVTAGIDYALSLAAGGAAARQELAGLKAAFDGALGFDSALLLEAFGPELIVVSDQAGLWGGYQVRDRSALERVIAGIEEVTAIEVTRQRLAGVEINHWPLPALWPLPEEVEGEGEIPEPVAELFGRLKSRLYWVEEDDYLIMASVPQVLAARAQIGADRSLGTWLSRDMQLDWRHSVFALAGPVRHSPRDVYHGYLGALYFIADLVGAEFDPFALPTWLDASLPASGRLGLRLDSGPDALSLSLDYEYSPAEVLFGGNSALALAAIGIGAAIAVPAYHDYRVRAEVAQAFAQAASLKLVVAETYYSTGRFPDAVAAAELAVQGDAVNFEVQPDSGAIAIRFGDGSAAPLAGTAAFLEPLAEADGSLAWRCYSDEIPPQHLPEPCR